MLLVDSEPTPIIMVSYFRPNDFRKSVESVLNNTICPFHLSIIDNSHGGLDAELDRINDPRVTIYRNSRNVGKGAAVNERFEEATGSSSLGHFVSMDSDIVVPPKWLFELKKAYFAVQEREKPGIIAPAIVNHQDNPWSKQFATGKLSMHRPGGLEEMEYYPGLYRNRYVSGPLFLIDTKFFRAAGMFYDGQLYGADDGILCKEATKRSRFTGINSNVEVLHLNEDCTDGYKAWKKRNITKDVDQCGHWD